MQSCSVVLLPYKDIKQLDQVIGELVNKFFKQSLLRGRV